MVYCHKEIARKSLRVRITRRSDSCFIWGCIHSWNLLLVLYTPAWPLLLKDHSHTHSFCVLYEQVNCAAAVAVGLFVPLHAWEEDPKIPFYSQFLHTDTHASTKPCPHIARIIYVHVYKNTYNCILTARTQGAGHKPAVALKSPKTHTTTLSWPRCVLAVG